MKWNKVFTTDHQKIGLQYGLAAAAFLLLGFVLVMLIRLQLAYPQGTFLWLEKVFPNGFPAGVMTADFYNELGAMHGTIMVFLGIVPMGVGAFGNYWLPTLIGAKEMVFPRMNAWSFWVFFAAGLLMLASFFAPGGAAQAGWTSYPPLAEINPGGQNFWLLGIFLLGVSSLLGAINFIVTFIEARQRPFMELPLLAWTQIASAFLLLLAFPPLQAASLLQLSDRLWGSSFFLPSGLSVSGEVLKIAGGGNPILWQHLFWFLAHPEVYVLILPAIGIVAEIITHYSGRKLYGYRTTLYALAGLTVLSFLVWAHHMFLTGMGSTLSTFFQATTMLISIPSVIVLVNLLLTLWGGSIRFEVPMLFGLAFLPMFGLGGLTGLPLGLAASDLHLHDTYYVIGHFHYIVAPGTIFALFGGVYYLWPALNARWGRVHFWGSFICMNAIFLPMFFIGMAGVSRRMYDMSFYKHGAQVFWLNKISSWGAWALALFQLIFLFNVARTYFRKRATA